MKVKTKDLTGISLDYAVALASGATELRNDDIRWFFTLHGDTYVLSNGWGGMSYQPSDNWVIGGPIIEQECIKLAAYEASSEVPKNPAYWEAVICTRWATYRQTGPTPLIAAMRCLCASKLGAEIEIPEELK